MTTPKNNSVLWAFAILRAFDERSPMIGGSEIAHQLFHNGGGKTVSDIASDEKLQ